MRCFICQEQKDNVAQFCLSYSTNAAIKWFQIIFRYLAIEFILEEFELRFSHNLTVDNSDICLPSHVLFMFISGRIVEAEHKVVRVNEGSET